MGDLNKKLNGQFFTIVNPFHNQLFLNWFNGIVDIKSKTLLEPFAGSNNIVKMIMDFYPNEWACYDIAPNNIENKVKKHNICQNNSLENFPQGFDVVITNPPYLAKNSATRDGLNYPNTEYDDIYKYSLSVMLNNSSYIAAIIPESFITQNLFHNRLYGVSSLNCRMFDDTECPVCLALFVPENCTKKLSIPNDFYYYKGNVNLGLYSNMKKELDNYKTDTGLQWKFNDPQGEIGLHAIDSTSGKSIRFVPGTEIPSEKVKVSSRGITKISGIPSDLDTDEVITEANQVLNQYRNNTNDVFLTSFRGLRKDGDYRRRLDFAFTKVLLNYVINKIREKHAQLHTRGIQ